LLTVFVQLSQNVEGNVVSLFSVFSPKECDERDEGLVSCSTFHLTQKKDDISFIESAVLRPEQEPTPARNPWQSATARRVSGSAAAIGLLTQSP
jgi:hypothetical protein